MPETITLVTRQSPLALTQTELTRDFLQSVFPEAQIDILKKVTTGDRKTNWSLEKKGGKGLFTKELEEALLDGDAHIAVHSAKDLPTEMPEHLALAGFLPREQVNDVLVTREGVAHPVQIGTSSPRRRAQAKLMFPNAEWTEIRGNVDTRLNKIADGQADATILAAAGLNRLKISEWPGVTFQPIDIRTMVPAVGQGAIALQTHVDLLDKFQPHFDGATAQAVTIERKFLAALGGGCHTAFGAHFKAGVLLTFHESVGIQEHAFEPSEIESPDARIATIVAQMQQQGA